MKDKSCEYTDTLSAIGARFIYVHPVADVYQNRFLENWQEITTIRKPIIAAVSGFAVNIRFPNSPSPSHPPFSPRPRNNSSALTMQMFQISNYYIPPRSSAEAASSP
jgi:hypothetical protein